MQGCQVWQTGSAQQEPSQEIFLPGLWSRLIYQSTLTGTSWSDSRLNIRLLTPCSCSNGILKPHHCSGTVRVKHLKSLPGSRNVITDKETIYFVLPALQECHCTSGQAIYLVFLWIQAKRFLVQLHKDCVNLIIF